MPETEHKKVKLNLVGVDGNAFAILATFAKAAKSQGWNKSEIDAVVKEATTGDYNHLLQTMLKYTESPEECTDED